MRLVVVFVLSAVSLYGPSALAADFPGNRNSCAFGYARWANGSVCTARCEPGGGACMTQICDGGRWWQGSACWPGTCPPPCGRR